MSTNSETVEPESIVRTIIDRWDDAWDKEGAIPGDLLTEDIVYTNLAGRILVGRDAVVEGTRQIKSAFRANVLKRDLVDARELAPTVLIARVLSEADILDGPRKGRVRGHQFYVIVWDSDAWRVLVYQNTAISNDD